MGVDHMEGEAKNILINGPRKVDSFPIDIEGL